MKKIPATVIISTKNEEAAIATCLAGVRDFDQIFVVDSHSQDRTREKAAELGGCEIVQFAWNGAYPKKKQWCLDALPIKHDWVLFVDADEQPTRELIRDAKRATEQSRFVAFDVPMRYYFMNRRLRFGHKVTKRVLVNRRSVAFPVVPDLAAPGMGELEGHYQPIADGRVDALKSQMIHRDPDPLRTWVHRHNNYSDWEAFLRVNPEALHAVRGVRSAQGRLFDKAPLKPFTFFVYSFILRLGFLDGRAGFDYAFALSFYYWLIDAKSRETP